LTSGQKENTIYTLLYKFLYEGKQYTFMVTIEHEKQYNTPFYENIINEGTKS